MIKLMPKSLFSWDFLALGLPSGSATVEYNWVTEQGNIFTTHHAYSVRKQGMLSGRWTLEQGNLVVAEAYKPSAFFRSFEVRDQSIQLTLRALSPMKREFVIEMDQRVIGAIRPKHAFTRKCVLHCPASIPEHMQLFAFWLAALTWKRAANHNDGAP